MAFPNQPQSLVGNTFSDAYFGALARRGMSNERFVCAYCDKALATRVTNGELAWCDAGHMELWLRQQRDKSVAQALMERGWSPERWQAAQTAEAKGK